MSCNIQWDIIAVLEPVHKLTSMQFTSMFFWLVKCQKNLPKRIRAPAIPAAVVDFVNSQTVKHEKGTRHDPRNVQN